MAKEAGVAPAVLADAAEQDLNDIWEFIAQDNIDAADRVRQELDEAIGKLVKMPRMGHTRNDLAAESLRFWPVRRYLFIYRPNEKPIQVVRVLHSARDVRAILEAHE